MGEVHPSQEALNQVARMQNQMTNQMYNQGLSGSTISQEALGAGETGAFDQDAMRQAQQILGLTGATAAARRAPGMEFAQLLGEGVGGLTHLLSAFLPAHKK